MTLIKALLEKGNNKKNVKVILKKKSFLSISELVLSKTNKKTQTDFLGFVLQNSFRLFYLYEIEEVLMMLLYTPKVFTDLFL